MEKPFASLEQRVAAGYLAMLPAFVPLENRQVHEAGQRGFYELMGALFRLLAEEPELLFPTLHPDDAFPTRYKKEYGKPQLQANLSKAERAVKGLLGNLFLLGQGREVKLNWRERKILDRLGAGGGALPEAWTWMARRPGADPVAFAYCLFDPDHVYTRGVFAPLLGEEPFQRLEGWMLSQGYRAYDMYNAKWPDYRLSLRYANPAWGPERPSIGNEYKVMHTGVSAEYDAHVASPASLGVCVPRGLKLFLQHFGEMAPQVRELVLERTKRCDGCRYCVQTDKSGVRPLACLLVEGEELCPYYPGYAYRWPGLSQELVDRLTGFLDFMDGFAPDRSASE